MSPAESFQECVNKVVRRGIWQGTVTILDGKYLREGIFYTVTVGRHHTNLARTGLMIRKVE